MKKVIVAIGARVALVAVFSLLLSAAALAQSVAVQKGESGKKEFRPPTGQERQALLEGIKHLVNRSDEGLTEHELSDGTKIVYLEGRFRSLALVKRNTDGTISAGCVNNQKDAEKFLKSDTEKEAAMQEAAKKPKPKPAPALEVK